MLKLLAGLALALAVASPAAAQDKRVALVIGNADYQHVLRMKNPLNDAADIGAALARMGFAVTIVNNATGDTMRRALSEFGAKAKAAETAVAFYAGHAVEMNDELWLIPIDAKGDTAGDVSSASVSLTLALREVGQALRLNFVMLDTGRHNPFAGKKPFGPVQGPVPRVARSELTKEPARNVLVSYATRAGEKAADGQGRNSPYTAALLKHIETPGLELRTLTRQVRDDVLTETKDRQTPFTYGSLSADDHFLMPR